MAENPRPPGGVSPAGPPQAAAAEPTTAARTGWSGDRCMTRTSEILRNSIESRRGARVTVAELMGTLGDRGFGLLIVLLVLPNLIPGPTIPGYSLVFAVGIALVASQLARGFARPMLPNWCLRRSFDRARLDALLLRAMPYLRRFERFAHARPSSWTTRHTERWIGGLCIAVALALAVPVPLGNTPPALSLLVLGLGLIERDSRLLTIGTVAGIASVLYVGALSTMTVLAAERIFGAAGTLFFA
jgi:hypothetical protein